MDRRWLAWSVFFLLLTTLLVLPGNVHEQLPLGEFILSRKVLFAKIVHLAFYAVFAILSGWLRVPLRWRPALMFLLMLHGAATEFIQLYVPYRNGSLSDVLFDHLGIAIGFLISWKWWTRSGT